MSWFLVGVARVVAIGLGVVAAASAYLAVCLQVHRRFPRVGMALAVPVICVPVAFFVWIFWYEWFGLRGVVFALLATYVVSVITGWILAFRR